MPVKVLQLCLRVREKLRLRKGNEENNSINKNNLLSTVLQICQKLRSCSYIKKQLIILQISLISLIFCYPLYFKV